LHFSEITVVEKIHIVVRVESRSMSSGFMEAKDAAKRVNCIMGRVASSLRRERIAKVFALSIITGKLV
jgi:hypothetical protein